MIIDTTLDCIEKDLTRKDFDCGYALIDPYERSFYSNPNKQFIGKEKEIEERGLERFKEALLEKGLSELPIEDCINRPLVKATLFGNDEDIVEAWVNIISGNDTGVNDIKCVERYLYASIVASICYCSKQNNGLEFLLARMKDVRETIKAFNEIGFGFALGSNVENRGPLSYCLLSLAAQNREAFELLSHEDPFNTNQAPWKFFSDKQYLTNLERMFDNRNFDQENIRVYMDNGGMTSKEIEFGDIVERVLENLSTRNIQMTLDEVPLIGLLRRIQFVAPEIGIFPNANTGQDFDVD